MFIDFSIFLDKLISEQVMKSRELDIKAGYIQNSNIRVLGDVIINKKGAINSNILAKGNIIVNSRNGYLRGGNYIAGDLIYSYEIGSKLSVTTLKVGTWVYAKKILGTIKIKAERDIRFIEPEHGSLNMKVDKAGELVSTS